AEFRWIAELERLKLTFPFRKIAPPIPAAVFRAIPAPVSAATVPSVRRKPPPSPWPFAVFRETRLLVRLSVVRLRYMPPPWLPAVLPSTMESVTVRVALVATAAGQLPTPHKLSPL